MVMDRNSFDRVERFISEYEASQNQEPFKISVAFATSEMLGKYILGKLETTEAWVVPIYSGTRPPQDKGETDG